MRFKIISPLQNFEFSFYLLLYSLSTTLCSTGLLFAGQESTNVSSNRVFDKMSTNLSWEVSTEDLALVRLPDRDILHISLGEQH